MVKLVGLTGGVGSGKSTVAAILRELGAEVVDADEASHAVYEPGTPGFAAVVREFGQDYVRDGRINRKALGELVFKDPRSLHRLNAIVHPLVREWMAKQTAEAVARGAEVVVQDVPLLFENKLEDLFPTTLLVWVPREVQVERLVIGRGFTRERAREVIAAQMPIDDKRSHATYVIDNTGTRQSTRTQVERLWEALASA